MAPYKRIENKDTVFPMAKFNSNFFWPIILQYLKLEFFDFTSYQHGILYPGLIFSLFFKPVIDNLSTLKIVQLSF